MQAWTWTVMPEVSMSAKAVQAMLNSDPIPSIRPKAMTQHQWMKAWLRQQEEHEGGPSFLGPTPPLYAGPQGAYAAYLQWLLDHPRSCLVGSIKGRTGCWVRPSTSTSFTAISSGSPLHFTVPMPCWRSGRV